MCLQIKKPGKIELFYYNAVAFIRQITWVQIVQEKAVGEVRPLAGERRVPFGGIGLSSEGLVAKNRLRRGSQDRLDSL